MCILHSPLGRSYLKHTTIEKQQWTYACGVFLNITNVFVKWISNQFKLFDWWLNASSYIGYLTMETNVHM